MDDEATSGQPRTVTVPGAGAAPVPPDAVRVVLAASGRGATPAEALRECAQVQASATQALARHGVPRSAVRAGGLRVEPQWDEARGRPGRPVATATLQIRLPDLASAGQVVTDVLDAGGPGLTLLSLRPVATEVRAALERAREDAWRDARRRAEQHAALADTALGPLLALQEGPGGPAGDGAARMQWLSSREESYSVADGDLDVQVTVVATWALQTAGRTGDA